MNGAANCIYAICCPPDSDEQLRALAQEMEKAGMFQSLEPEARRVGLRSVAAWMLKNFDLAPKGSLQAFKDEIAKLARENP